MRINLAATKSNLFRVKKTLALAHEGFELLDEKRRILINELNNIIHIAESLEYQTDELLREAYALTDQAMVLVGRKRLEALSFSVDITHALSISQKRVMGVNVPAIALVTTQNPPYYSPREVGLVVDEVIAKFKEVTEKLAELAGKKIAILRLAKEVQKTIRKVNALQKIYIPYYAAASKSISDRLDEESRDAFSMLKMIKERLRQ